MSNRGIASMMITAAAACVALTACTGAEPPAQAGTAEAPADAPEETSTATPEPDLPGEVLRPDGYENLRLGMTIPQAKATGFLGEKTDMVTPTARATTWWCPGRTPARVAT